MVFLLFNFLLSLPLSLSLFQDIDDLLMQCKSIELLQVLLEETDTNSTRVVQAISKDLKKEKVIQFIDDIYHMVHTINYSML